MPYSGALVVIYDALVPHFAERVSVCVPASILADDHFFCFSYLEKQAGCEMLGKSRASSVPTVLGLSTVQYWCEGG